MARKSATAPVLVPPVYDVHPGVAMVQKFVAELPEKTGKTLEEWGELVDAQGFDTAAEKRDFLKKTHGFGTNADTVQSCSPPAAVSSQPTHLP